MMVKKNFTFLLVLGACYFISTLSPGCAQIGFPTGGDRDSLAPVLEKASPALGSINVNTQRFTLEFDEYIELQDLQANLLVSPVQKNNPVITFNRRMINIRLRDTLIPNTTYSINFGDAIKDINEGNQFRDFTYIFSTGAQIDSLEFSGAVKIAESGKVDSSLQVLLYRTTDDSAVQKRKPDYITRLRGDGKFTFKNLPEAEFKVYALKDGDGGKTYNSPSEIFAFSNTPVRVTQNTPAIVLNAYALEKAQTTATTIRLIPEKRLRITNNLEQNAQTLLDSLELSFNNKLLKADLSLLALTDTNSVKLNAGIFIDSNRKKISIAYDWRPGESYQFIIPKEAISDTLGNSIPRNDTIRFKAKKNEDYGRVVLRFPNYDPSKKQVLQFLQSGNLVMSFPITSNEWRNNLFPPGEYEIRILFDDNGNGIWDPGDYSIKRQPETGITLPQSLSIRADWDNERDIRFD